MCVKDGIKCLDEAKAHTSHIRLRNGSRAHMESGIWLVLYLLALVVSIIFMVSRIFNRHRWGNDRAAAPPLCLDGHKSDCTAPMGSHGLSQPRGKAGTHLLPACGVGSAHYGKPTLVLFGAGLRTNWTADQIGFRPLPRPPPTFVNDNAT